MPKQRNIGKYKNPAYNQAAKIIKKFGGESKFAKITGISRITAYRWSYKRPYGTDGLIPSANIEKIKTMARLEGIHLTEQDWVPEKNRYANEPETVITLAEVLS